MAAPALTVSRQALHVNDTLKCSGFRQQGSWKQVLQIRKLRWGSKDLCGVVTFSPAQLINSMSACIYKYCLRLHHLLCSERATVASLYGAGTQELLQLRYVSHANLMNKYASGEGRSDIRVQRQIRGSCPLYHGDNNAVAPWVTDTSISHIRSFVGVIL